MEQIIKIKDRKVYESLVHFLKTLGLDVNGESIKTKSSRQAGYPLEGTLLKYEHPFDPAVDPDQWDSNQ